jgi:DNA-binding CsgD family transcriptional regulator
MPKATAKKKKKSVKPSPFKSLSERYLDIVALKLQGLSNAEISVKLGITMETVKSYRKLIYRRLKIHSTEELIELNKEYKAIRGKRKVRKNKPVEVEPVKRKPVKAKPVKKKTSKIKPVKKKPAKKKPIKKKSIKKKAIKRKPLKRKPVKKKPNKKKPVKKALKKKISTKKKPVNKKRRKY